MESLVPSWFLIEDETILWERLILNCQLVENDEEFRKIFKIGKILGKGNFGIVMEAHYVHNNEIFALKILDRSILFKGADVKLSGSLPRVESLETNMMRCPSSSELSDSSNEQQERAVRRLRRLVNEIEVMKYLKNTNNISKFFGGWITNRRIYVALNYVKNAIDLFEFVVRFYPIPSNTLKPLFLSICQTCLDFSNKGVVHRDLKLENILLDEENTPIVIDFGMSARFEAGMLLHSSCGTPLYAAPEVISANETLEGYRGPPVDVWSLGVILFALLTNTLPFVANNYNDLKTKIMKGAINIPKFVNIDFANLLKSMLVVDPTERFTLQQVIDHPLFNTKSPFIAAQDPMIGTVPHMNMQLLSIETGEEGLTSPEILFRKSSSILASMEEEKKIDRITPIDNQFSFSKEPQPLSHLTDSTRDSMLDDGYGFYTNALEEDEDCEEGSGGTPIVSYKLDQNQQIEEEKNVINVNEIKVSGSEKLKNREVKKEVSPPQPPVSVGWYGGCLYEDDFFEEED